MKEVFIQRPFFEILDDAILLLDSSYLEENTNTNKYNKTFVKMSILNSIFLLECCANCCLDAHPYPKKFLKSIDKLPAIEKYEFLLLTRNENLHINRGDTIIQIFSELVKIRNQYVHPRTEKKDFKNNSNKEFKPGEHYNIQTEPELTDILKIPKQSIHWNPGHAIKVLKAVNIFFREFFLKWCKFSPEETTNFLSNEVQNPQGNFQMISEKTKKMMEIAMNRWNVDFSYINYTQN